jgi:hypothetical protein
MPARAPLELHSETLGIFPVCLIDTVYSLICRVTDLLMSYPSCYIFIKKLRWNAVDIGSVPGHNYVYVWPR